MDGTVLHTMIHSFMGAGKMVIKQNECTSYDVPPSYVSQNGWQKLKKSTGQSISLKSKKPKRVYISPFHHFLFMRQAFQNFFKNRIRKLCVNRHFKKIINQKMKKKTVLCPNDTLRSYVN